MCKELEVAYFVSYVHHASSLGQQCMYSGRVTIPCSPVQWTPSILYRARVSNIWSSCYSQCTKPLLVKAIGPSSIFMSCLVWGSIATLALTLSCMLTLNFLLARSSLMTAVCPHLAALCRAVRPFCRVMRKNNNDQCTRQ